MSNYDFYYVSRQPLDEIDFSKTAMIELYPSHDEAIKAAGIKGNEMLVYGVGGKYSCSTVGWLLLARQVTGLFNDLLYQKADIIALYDRLTANGVVLKDLKFGDSWKLNRVLGDELFDISTSKFLPPSSHPVFRELRRQKLESLSNEDWQEVFIHLFNHFISYNSSLESIRQFLINRMQLLSRIEGKDVGIRISGNDGSRLLVTPQHLRNNASLILDGRTLKTEVKAEVETEVKRVPKAPPANTTSLFSASQSSSSDEAETHRNFQKSFYAIPPANLDKITPRRRRFVIHDSRRDLFGLVHGRVIFAAEAFSMAQVLSEGVRRGVDFSHADLRNQNLSGAMLKGGKFAHALFDGSDLTDATLDEGDFSHASFAPAGGILGKKAANLKGASLNRTCFEAANFHAAYFNAAHGDQIDFANASLDGAHFNDAIFKNIFLHQTEYDRTDVKKASEWLQTTQKPQKTLWHGVQQAAQDLGKAITDNPLGVVAAGVNIADTAGAFDNMPEDQQKLLTQTAQGVSVVTGSWQGLTGKTGMEKFLGSTIFASALYAFGVAHLGWPTPQELGDKIRRSGMNGADHLARFIEEASGNKGQIVTPTSTSTPQSQKLPPAP